MEIPANPASGTKETAGVAQVAPGQIRFALGLTVAMLFAALLLNVSWLGNLPHDLVLIYTGASIVRQGNGSKLYDLREQASVQEALFKGQPLLYYNHPPFEALLFAPLTALSYKWAFMAWGAINIALWMLFVRWVRPYAPVPAQPFQYLILCFAFIPLWAALMQGQTSVLLLALFTLTFICLKRQQDFRAGLCLGLGLFKFPVVLAFTLICLVARKWKLMAGFASAASFLTALSVVAVGTAGLSSYVRLLLDLVRHPHSAGYGMRFADMANVRGLFSTLSAGAFAPRTVNVAVAFASLSLILYAAREWGRQKQQGSARSFDLIFAAALVISEVTSFHTLIHDLSPTLLAILVAMGAYPWSKKSPWFQGLGVIMSGLYVLPVGLAMFGPQNLLTTGGEKVSGSAIWLLTPLLIAFAVIALVAARKTPAESPPGHLQNLLANTENPGGVK